MHEVQEIRSAKREDDGAEERRRAGEVQTAQEEIHPGEHQDVTQHELEHESPGQREEAVQQEVRGVIHPSLALAVQVHPRVEVRAPQKRMPRSERLLVDASDRQVQVAEIVSHVHPPDQQGGAQHQD